MDEDYIKLNGKWVYLYRIIDKKGNIIDFLLRARLDKASAKALLKKAVNRKSRPKKAKLHSIADSDYWLGRIL